MASRKRLVFISHSGQDTWVAKQIEREVAACGATTFLDYAHITTGGNFEEKIIEALNRADELLLLLTPWALDHPYIWSEAGVAWGRQIPIIGILSGMSTEEFLAKPNIPVYLKARNLKNINEIDQYLKELATRTEKPKKSAKAKAKRR
jgi:hypothetical protein